jgi:prepilin-type N-terminal cleavage/methylation domain-containing protein
MIRNCRGFNLIEVLIVLVTVAIVVVLIIPYVQEKKVRELREFQKATIRDHLVRIAQAESVYHDSTGRWTDSLDSLARYVAGIDTLRNPITGTRYAITPAGTTSFSVESGIEEFGYIDLGRPTWR